jgi:hypothetical protein
MGSGNHILVSEPHPRARIPYVLLNDAPSPSRGAEVLTLKSRPMP